MDINTISLYLIGLIIAGGIMRIAWLLLILIFSDAPPYKIHDIKHRIAIILLAIMVAVSVTGLVAYIRGYF